jgi:hypothetical protein
MSILAAYYRWRIRRLRGRVLGIEATWSALHPAANITDGLAGSRTTNQDELLLRRARALERIARYEAWLRPELPRAQALPQVLLE